MNKKVKDPRCEQCKTACKSYSEGYCTILTDTNFGKRECPFYRQKSESALLK